MSALDTIVVPFDQIFDAVKRGRADVGLIIHEGQLTYANEQLDLILDLAEKVGVRPTIGMRVKLAARGGGRWQSSGGYRSKFGLTVGEILKGLNELKTRGMEDCFQLLHFHLGSQIPNIRIVKGALNEAAMLVARAQTPTKARRQATTAVDRLIDGFLRT